MKRPGTVTVYQLIVTTVPLDCEFPPKADGHNTITARLILRELEAETMVYRLTDEEGRNAVPAFVSNHYGEATP